MLFNSVRKKSFFHGVSTTSDQTAPEINLIPFIDVLLVILIFLMISTTFTRYQELSITLPSAEGAAAKGKPRDIAVAISSDGRVAIDGKRIALDQLTNVLTTSAKNTGGDNGPNVIIAADGKAPHQSVMLVMEAARNANLPNVVFATQSKSK
ncbi:MAG: ExbD/TolR family protein [Polynucleobacter victoriensis]